MAGDFAFKPMRLYHGTSARHLESIKKKGIEPRYADNVGPPRESPRVWLSDTKKEAMGYARDYQGFGHNSRVLEVEVPSGAVVKGDARREGAHYWTGKTVEPSRIKKVHGTRSKQPDDSSPPIGGPASHPIKYAFRSDKDE